MSIEHPSVTAAQLEKIADMFLEALRGRAGDALDLRAGPSTLGSLMHVVAAHGVWRPDWMTCARGVLGVAIDAYRATASGFKKSNDAAGAASAIRLDLGLDVYPYKPGGIKVLRGNRSNWKHKLFVSPQALEAVAYEIERLGGVCDGSCRARPQDRWANWNLAEPSYWVDQAHDQWLIARARTALAATLADEHDSDEILRSLVCSAVASRLAEYFNVNNGDNNFYRHVHQTVLPAWSRWLIRGAAPVTTGTEKPQGGEFKAVTNAAVAMIAPLVTSPSDEGQRLRFEHDRMRAAGATSALWPTLDADVTASADEAALEIADFRGISRMAVTGRFTSLLAHSPAADSALSGMRPTDGDSFMQQAWDIRGCPDWNLKLRSIAVYIAARRDVILSRSNISIINLADQVVHWDTVTAELPELGADLAQAMEANPPLRASGYRTHRYRSMAIHANKHDMPGLADHLLNLGVAELASAADDHLPEIEHLESAHQLVLARAGVWVRQTEAYLRELPARGGPVPQLESAAHGAVAAAGQAYRLLLRLAPELPTDPVSARAQGRIAAASWHVQTRIIRLRASLAARTAIRSGLCGEGILVDLPDMDRQVVLDDGALIFSWRDLTGRKELTSAHQLDLCRLALWLTFLNGMELPLTAEVPNAMATLYFLDGDPEKIDAGQDTRTVNPFRVSEWLTRHGNDAGWLSWAGHRSAAARVLHKTSGGTYRPWLTEEVLRCKEAAIPRSHD